MARAVSTMPTLQIFCKMPQNGAQEHLEREELLKFSE